MNNRIISLFSGAGGFDLGFIKNGFDIVLANDFNIDACNSYRKNIGDIICDDIKNLKDLPSADAIIGGPPCQGFSTANPNRCLDDKRNWLFKQYFRIIKEVSPEIFVMENVSGMKTLSGGKVLEIILSEIKNIGYNYYYKILNSYDFGSPQKRKRLIIVGSKKCFEFPEVNTNKKVLKDVILKPFAKNDPCHIPMISKLSSLNIERLSYIPQGGSMKDCPKRLQNNSDLNRAMRRLNMDEPSHTIVHNNCDHYYHPIEERRITIREMARIQGYPDNYIFTGSKTEQSRQVGNSVPIDLAYAISKSVKKNLNNNEKI